MTKLYIIENIFQDLLYLLSLFFALMMLLK